MHALGWFFLTVVRRVGGMTLPPDYYTPRNPTVRLGPTLRPTVTAGPLLTPTVTLSQ